MPVLGREDRRLFDQFVGQYDAPAYVRRALQVQNALDGLVERCRQQREQWLTMVRLRLGRLKALAGDWSVLQPLLAGEEHLALVRQLHADLDPKLRVAVKPTSSPRTLRRALRELRQSLERFNRRWLDFLPTVDLTAVNELRDGYNRYYLLEKECSVGVASVARRNFQRLNPLTHEELLALLPPLPVPQLQA
jgi:hypothetical protein